MTVIDILRKVKPAFHKRPTPALYELDQKLQQYLNFEAGFFIECGANDGYTQSNTYFLEKKLNWRGILVEGIPELYRRCEIERPAAQVYNCALVADDYADSTATMHYANLMSLVDGAMTTDAQKEHLVTGAATYSVEVPARTLTSILADIDELPPIDFFSLDVEGYELNVLKGLDFGHYRPTYILVEARQFQEVNDFLVGARYTMLDKFTVHDYLYRTEQEEPQNE